MGAMLRFKKETGKEVTETTGGFSDLCTYLWCCVASASKHDGKKFTLSLMDFADSISPDDMSAWQGLLQENAAGKESEDEDEDEGEKKSSE